jgi:hypothetical protein
MQRHGPRDASPQKADARIVNTQKAFRRVCERQRDATDFAMGIRNTYLLDRASQPWFMQIAE